jgi:hypothetical protein
MISKTKLIILSGLNCNICYNTVYLCEKYGLFGINNGTPLQWTYRRRN